MIQSKIKYKFNLYFNNVLLEHIEFTPDEKIISKYERLNLDKKYQPYGVSFDRKPPFKQLMKFFESRLPTQNTPNSDSLLRRCGLISYDIFKLILITQGRNYKDKVWLDFETPIITSKMSGDYYDKYECIDVE